MAKPLNAEIAKFILDQVEAHPDDIGPHTARQFGVSRTTTNNYLKRLVDDGVLSAEGATRARTYKLRILDERQGVVEITPSTQDDEVWRNELRPAMAGLPENLVAICQYGFTEMFNNVIDHSESRTCYWNYRRDAKKIELSIIDIGVGIFKKLRDKYDLYDDRDALFELSKGKITSDPERHTGEGIFFTSRAFDQFTLASHHLQYTRIMEDDDQWLLDIAQPDQNIIGTRVNMQIDTDSPRTLMQVFSMYQGDDFSFSRTHVHVSLAKIGEDQLISRSQAKRVMTGLNKFREVLLDFSDIETVGQGFTDEIFRVFQNQHLDIEIIPIKTNSAVAQMIAHVRARDPSGRR